MKKIALKHCARILAALFFANLAFAAPHVKPPLQAIRDYGAVVIDGQVLAIDEATNVVAFQIERGINAERAVARVNIRVPAEALALLSPKLEYLFVVIDERKDPKNPGNKIPLEVQELLVYDGAGPAIYLASEQARALFAPGHQALEAGSGYRTQLLAGLKDADPQLADLYCAELVTRVELRQALSRAEIATLMDAIADQNLRPQTRARILDSATAHFFEASPEMLRQASLAVLASAPVVGTQGVENSDALTMSALNYFANSMEVPENVSANLIVKFLRSPQPALAETALRILVRTAPDAVDGYVAAALRYSLLSRDARIILMRHRAQASQ